MYLVIEKNSDFYKDDYHEEILGLIDQQMFEFYELFNSGALVNAKEVLLYSVGNHAKLSSRYLALDLLPATQFLVSAKFASLLREHCRESIELIPAAIINGEDYYDGYFSVNILNIVDCIDFKKSDTYRMLPSDPSSKIVINHAVFKDGGLEGIDLATAKDGPEFVLASQGFADLCRDRGITGLDFWPNGSPP